MPPPPVHCYLVTLRPKYLAQHPDLQHPQPMFLPQGETEFHTHIKQEAKLGLCLSIFLFSDRKREIKYSRQAVAIPRVPFALTSFTKAIFICYGCSQIFDLCHPSNGFIMLSLCCDFVLHSIHDTSNQTLMCTIQSQYLQK